MATEAGVVSGASPAGSSSAKRGEYAFEATPCGQGTVKVEMRRVSDYVYVYVEGMPVVRIPSQNWRVWLTGRERTFALYPLIMRRATTGIWFEIEDRVAPQIVSPAMRVALLELVED